ncbi:MAG: hypothetical protein ACYC5H_06980 [Methylovirgula sp.]
MVALCLPDTPSDRFGSPSQQMEARPHFDQAHFQSAKGKYFTMPSKPPQRAECNLRVSREPLLRKDGASIPCLVPVLFPADLLMNYE